MNNGVPSNATIQGMDDGPANLVLAIPVVAPICQVVVEVVGSVGTWGRASANIENCDALPTYRRKTDPQ